MSVEFIWAIVQVAIGLGFVIFVHELGHFAVAKMCGVQCDKFMIGFDIGGCKISKKWGETVYGIGIIPLGGYVKMLGQDDDPSKIAEQIEQSRLDPQLEGVEVTGPGGEKYKVDPRSYLAKSVPQRMAIISAGVIMNIIFAFIFAVIAFGLGVPYVPSIVSQTVPGSPAWQANLRTGDDIVEIGNVEDPSFSQLTGKVTLADLEQGLPLVIQHGASGTKSTVTLHPRQQDGKGLAKIGIVSPYSLQLVKEEPVRTGSAAAVENGFEGGDEIIEIQGNPVENYQELIAALVAQVDQPLEVTVRRDGTPAESGNENTIQGGKKVTVEVPPNPMRRLGLVMQMGPVIATQQDSPAQAAKLPTGHSIVAITTPTGRFSNAAGDQPLDPLSLPHLLRQLTKENDGSTIELSLSDSTNLAVKQRKVNWLDSDSTPGTPVALSSLGIAYEVRNVVVSVTDNSPAQQAGLQAGDELVAAEISFPQADGGKTKTLPIQLGDQPNFPMLIGTLQRLPIETKVELTYRRGEKENQVILQAKPDSEHPVYLVDRGFLLQTLQRVREAKTVAGQFQLGWDRTVESLMLVYRFLQKLGTQVPVTALGGPETIAKAAFYSASEGTAALLVFLTMLSANLAVVNFLPIPILDGGHMVFLAYEGIFRRPANEKFVVAMHTIGFAFIIGLMLFLIALDRGLIPRNL